MQTLLEFTLRRYLSFHFTANREKSVAVVVVVVVVV